MFILMEYLKRKIEKFFEDYKNSLYIFFVVVFLLFMYWWILLFDIGLGMVYGNCMIKMEWKLIGMMVSIVFLRMDIDLEEEVFLFISRVFRK